MYGPTGLARIHGHARTHAERSGFRAQIAAARYGAIDLGVVLCTAHSRDNEGTNFGHTHPVSRLVVVIQGRVEVAVGGRVVDMVPGTGLLTPGVSAVQDRASHTVTRLYLDIATQASRFSALLRDTAYAYWSTPSPALDGLVAFGRSVLAADDATMGRACRGEVQRLLDALAVATIAAAPPLPADDPHHLSVRSLALGRIRQQFTDPQLSPASLAQDLDVSVRTLQRAFSNGPGVAEWIARFRRDHALELLGDERFDSLSIAEIAARAGYGSPASMRRAVIMATGHGPVDLRHRT